MEFILPLIIAIVICIWIISYMCNKREKILKAYVVIAFILGIFLGINIGVLFVKLIYNL